MHLAISKIDQILSEHKSENEIFNDFGSPPKHMSGQHIIFLPLHVFFKYHINFILIIK